MLKVNFIQESDKLKAQRSARLIIITCLLLLTFISKNFSGLNVIGKSQMNCYCNLRHFGTFFF